jgi:hypothetical protein
MTKPLAGAPVVPALVLSKTTRSENVTVTTVERTPPKVRVWHNTRQSHTDAWCVP